MPRTTETRSVLTVPIRPELLQLLKAHCKERQIPMACLVRDLIRQAVEKT